MALASIRIRLTAWYGSLLIVTISGLGIALCLLMARSLLERVDAMLDFELDEASERLVAGQSADRLTSAPAAFHEAFLIRILTSDGRTLAQSPALTGYAIPVPRSDGSQSPLRHASVHLGSLGSCRVVTGAVGSGAERRLIQIATSLESYESELAELHSVLWMILPAGLIVATAGGYWLATRALSPVQRMTEAAQRISASNLSDRIDLLNVDDELGRLGLTLNAMLDRICHAFAANRRFTADAAHELKTPLASIRAEAEVALLCTRTLSEYEATLRGIVEEVERLTRLTEQLLRLAREDSGATLSRQSTRLDVAVRAAVNNATLAASDAGVALHLGELARAEVNCDQDLLRQVFDILLDNAVKYTPAGGAVTLSARCHAGHVIVEVADTGVGIPDEELARVFDRFYRVDSSRSRRTGGTGLGLSIAKAMIERHGGTTDATSKPGLGSTFRVVLPTCGDESQLCSYHDI